jgi:hypothetical protein
MEMTVNDLIELLKQFKKDANVTIGDVDLFSLEYMIATNSLKIKTSGSGE